MVVPYQAKIDADGKETLLFLSAGVYRMTGQRHAGSFHPSAWIETLVPEDRPGYPAAWKKRVPREVNSAMNTGCIARPTEFAAFLEWCRGRLAEDRASGVATSTGCQDGRAARAY